MKKNKIILLLTAMSLLAVSCGKEVVAPSVVSVDVNDSQYDTDNQEVWISGIAQTITADISGTDLIAASPTSDKWFIPYVQDGKLYIKVEMNEGDTERSSHVDLIGPGGKARLSIRQDFIRTLAFVSSVNNVDASDGTYYIPLATNMQPSQITVTVTEGDWITSAAVTDGFVVIETEANPSTTNEREGRLKVDAVITDEKTGNTIEYSNVTRINQSSMSGYPYEIDITAMDFDTYPVYDVYDGTHDLMVAQVAREYLYKYDSVLGVTTVDGVFTVAYPVFDGKVNYQNGLVLENNGSVSWKANITSDDRGRDMITFYSDGGETLTPSKVYLARGSKSLRLTPLSSTDAAQAVPVVPLAMKLVDHKEGAADNHGNTVEEYTYPVVKIGSQYWLKDNYKSSRWADGSPIPTPVTKEVWADDMASPFPVLKAYVVLMNGTSRYFDANDPANASYRNTAGCLYTYGAVIGGDLTLPEKSSANPKKTDKISPSGYTVPSISDFEILKSYVIQKTGLSNEETQKELVDKLTYGTSYSNVSGFSARGTCVVGRSGGYVSYTNYLTMDYVWSGSSHAEQVFRVSNGNVTYTYNLALYHAVYLRLLKK